MVVTKPETEETTDEDDGQYNRVEYQFSLHLWEAVLNGFRLRVYASISCKTNRLISYVYKTIINTNVAVSRFIERYKLV